MLRTRSTASVKGPVLKYTARMMEAMVASGIGARKRAEDGGVLLGGMLFVEGCFSERSWTEESKEEGSR